MNYKLTVVMSVYNGQNYLSKAIESILSQSYSSYYFFIVNNGSDDHTASILEFYSKNDPRITIFTNPPGLTYVEGRAKAIDQVRTEWIALMDADDYAEPTRFERQMQFIEQYKGRLGAVGTWAITINSMGNTVGRITMEPTSELKFRDLYSNNEAIVPLDPSIIFSKSGFVETGGYRKDTVPAADLDFYYRLAETGRDILVIPEFLMQYRIHSSSASIEHSMHQRFKTHFINYNMRRRRLGEAELSLYEFDRQIWSRWYYKIPRIRNDLGLICYKHAGHSFAERKYPSMLLYLIIAFIFKPVHIFMNISKQIKYTVLAQEVDG